MSRPSTSSLLLKYMVMYGVVGCLGFGVFGMAVGNYFYLDELDTHKTNIERSLVCGHDISHLSCDGLVCGVNILYPSCDGLLELAQRNLENTQQSISAVQYFGFPIGLVGSIFFAVLMYRYEVTKGDKRKAITEDSSSRTPI